MYSALLAEMARMREELAALKAPAAASDADERAPLWAEAEDRGIMIDRRWGIDRLQRELARA